MRAALFVPCFVDAFRPSVARATRRVLERLGLEVVVPRGQSCCGQPALNAGHFEDARLVARRHLEVLAAADADWVVVPSGSCASALRVEGPKRLGLDHPVLERLVELSELLVEKLGVTDVGAVFPGRVTWHDACHPLRFLGLDDAPRRLLAAVEGIELVEMESASECCGFGGLFSVKMPEVSTGMGVRKVDAAERSGAAWIASTEASCLLQIQGLLDRRRSTLRTVHLAEILSSEAGGDRGGRA